MKSIIEFLKSLVVVKGIQGRMEDYIIAGKPVDAAGVERLAQEFFTTQESRRGMF